MEYSKKMVVGWLRVTIPLWETMLSIRACRDADSEYTDDMLMPFMCGLRSNPDSDEPLPYSCPSTRRWWP
jgi:hypothetical protein